MENLTIEQIQADYEEMDEEEFNGRWKSMNFNSLAKYVQDYHRFVCDDKGRVNIVNTAMYVIWSICKKPVAYDKINNADVPEVIKAMYLQIIRANFIDQTIESELINKSDYRKSDLVMDSKFIAFDDTKEEVKKLKSDAKKILKMISKNETYSRFIEENGAYSLWLLFANALCRYHTNGHNYLTNQLADQKNYLSKIMNIAGADRQGFTAFCSKNNIGHDMYHFLSDEAISRVCNALRGEKRVLITEGKSAFGQTAGKEGLYLHNLVALPQSLLDRYPPGLVGTSSIVLGINYLKVMLSDMRSKNIKFEYEKSYDDIAKIEAALKDKKLLRSKILELRESLSFTLAYAIGYCTISSNLDVDKHLSLRNILSNNEYAFSIGAAAAKKVKAIKLENLTDSELVEQSVVSIGKDLTSSATRVSVNNYE